MPETADLDADHVGLTDTWAARRYFRQFEAITGHLVQVSQQMQDEGTLSRSDAEMIAAYLRALTATFRALSHKYLLTGRDGSSTLGALKMDQVESGFPVFAEILMMANDAQQAARHLAQMPGPGELREQMIREIVGELRVPVKLQYAMSQRLYYEALTEGGLYWAQNDPVAIWAGETAGRRHYVLHWGVYDSQVNLPTIYLMDLEDSGEIVLPKDTRRWPEAQRHLIAQSLAGLKLLTIARGFDRDFDDLHPKRLRRIHIGPMYSATYTRQTGPLHEVLEDTGAGGDEDWALAWTLEVLESERVEQERAGWFGKVDREIFALDPFSGRGADTGATRTERSIILPERPFQVLSEKNPPGFRDVRKFVVAPSGRVMGMR